MNKQESIKSKTIKEANLELIKFALRQADVDERAFGKFAVETVENRIGLFEICHLLGIYNIDESMTNTELIFQIIIPKLEKVEVIKNDETSFKDTIEKLWKFWQVLLNHPRSKIDNHWSRKLEIRIIQSDYDDVDIMCAIIALSKSEYHVENKYTHIQYICRSNQQFELMLGKAEKLKISREFAISRFQFVINLLSEGQPIKQVIELYKKSFEINENVNQSTGAKLV